MSDVELQLRFSDEHLLKSYIVPYTFKFDVTDLRKTSSMFHNLVQSIDKLQLKNKMKPCDIK